MTELEIAAGIVALIVVAWWDVRRLIHALVAELSTERWERSVRARRLRGESLE